jgi:hypothetical protein
MIPKDSFINALEKENHFFQASKLFLFGSINLINYKTYRQTTHLQIQ